MFSKAAIIVNTKLFNLDDWKQQGTHKKWSYITDHQYRILIYGGSGSGKTNALLNLISQHDGIDKSYWYAKDLNEPKSMNFWSKSVKMQEQNI